MRLLLLLLLTALPLSASAPDGNPPSGQSATARAPAPDSPARTETKGSKWKFSLGAPAADGSKSILATLRADAPIASGFGQVTPRLVLRYHAGQTLAFVVFDTFLGSGELAAAVTFGGHPPEEQRWRISSDGMIAFIPGDALAFVERLKEVESFSVRIAPHKANPVTVSFTPLETELMIKALISAGVKYGG